MPPLFSLSFVVADDFPDGQDIVAVFMFIAHLVDEFLHKEYAEPADRPLLQRERQIRVRLLQRIVGNAAVDEYKRQPFRPFAAVLTMRKRRAFL